MGNRTKSAVLNPEDKGIQTLRRLAAMPQPRPETGPYAKVGLDSVIQWTVPSASMVMAYVAWFHLMLSNILHCSKIPFNSVHCLLK